MQTEPAFHVIVSTVPIPNYTRWEPDKPGHPSFTSTFLRERLQPLLEEALGWERAARLLADPENGGYSEIELPVVAESG